MAECWVHAICTQGAGRLRSKSSVGNYTFVGTVAKRSTRDTSSIVLCRYLQFCSSLCCSCVSRDKLSCTHKGSRLHTPVDLFKHEK